ncbi:unnamed protein product [Tuber melanosporum]|uniref:(Perigord truffle) hypothetical protein n=1 Tax=Tuber melanosporum (strain Mel28) TaxID=656061 RepID=D5GDS4_TUBMM|nr:uncharacterized protein GSTUM_00006249001 [Tuber melanosporum]CAZ82667.1 unnamed protein product [Tuber melanosporum]
MGPSSNPLSSPPRLPSPPPFTEVQISPVPLSLSLSKSPVRPVSNSATRRIRPGTKSRHIAAGPPLVPLSELESAFQLQEHLASLLAATTSPPGSDTTVPLSREACERLATPPEGIEEYLWCYELTRRLTRDLNILLVALLKDNCTASSCPEMRASEWQYLCAVHDPPQSCCAIDYSTHTLDQAATMLCTNRYFPSRLSPHNTSVKHLASIFRRLYRIFAHAWFQHRSVFWEVENEFGLYLFFKTVSEKYSLIPEDNLTLPPEAEGLKSKNSFGEVDSDEEEIDEFDRGAGSREHGQELDEDEDYPDSDESESDEEEADGEEEGELEIENSIEGDEVEDDEFDLDIDDDHSVEEEGSGNSALTETHGNFKGETRGGEREHNLLLLPSPQSYSLVSLMETYKLAFGAAFRAAPLDTPSTLDIAVYAPFLSSLNAVRGRHFDKTQHLLARLYSIVNSVAVEEKRELAVDARIILLSDIGPKEEERASGFGPVIGLRELAKSGREWKNIIVGAHSPGSSEGQENREKEEAEGQAIEKAFLCYRGDKVTGYTDVWRCEIVTLSEEEPKEAVENDKLDDAAVEHLIVAGMPSTSTTSLHPFADPYKVGGTFDHLHPGHKLLLTMTAFLLSPNAAAPRLVAGITGETLLINKKHSAHLGSWDSRAAEVVDFLRGITDFSANPSQLLTSPSSSTPETDITPRSITATIPGGEKELVIETVEINDPFGPTITNEAISALVVSEETKNGGEAVNKKRTEKSWDALQVYKVDVIDNEGGVKMSSTDIRRKLEERSTA